MQTKPELSSFYTLGFQKLPFCIPADLLSRLRELFDELMDPADPHEKGIQEYGGRQYVTNLECICRKGNLAALELLGYPPILEIAAAICGPDFFMIQEFAVIKNRGDELPVLWHQDMLHERKGDCLTMGIYLDDVEQGDGALRVVPGSHLDGRSICELSKEPFIEISARTGEILIHDMMLAHSSEPMRINPLRRVVYFEFLSAAHVRAEQIYTEELVHRRRRLIFAASRYYESLHPDEAKFVHTGREEADQDKDLTAILAAIYAEHINARPSTYCLEFQPGATILPK